jgi:CoA:oxalate CoA-transferase
MTATPPAGPLNGIVVVDMTRVLAGPYCTLILSDLGARVIKVEPPGTGDDSRGFGPFINGKSAYFASLNRGKESVALDLKKKDDRALFEALLAKADVLIENYRGGTMARLGYGWDSLHARFPRLIYAACSGFGQTGPYANRAAYDMVVQAMGGVMSITGHPGGPPTRVGTSIGDLTAGLFTAIGVNAALVQRQTTGRGMMIDVSMLDCQIAILENAIARYVATGQVPGPLGARHPSITPFEAFATADGHMVIAAGNDGLFVKLAEALGQPGLATNPLFNTNEQRTRHQPALKAEIEAVTRTRPTAEWLLALERFGVPAGPINRVDQALADAQVRHRNMLVSIDDPTMGTVQMAGNPIKMSAYPDPPTRGAVPALDGDRTRLVAEFAGRRG